MNTRTKISDTLRAQVVEAYPHESNKALGLRFGLKEATVQKLGCDAGVRKDPATAAKSRRTAMIGLTADECAARDDYMREAYRVRPVMEIAAKLGLSRQGVRSYAHRLGLTKTRATPQRPSKPRADAHAIKTAAELAALPMVIPAGLKIQRAPAYTHNPKYQVCPGAEVPKVFRQAPIGINPLTLRPWGAV